MPNLTQAPRPLKWTCPCCAAKIDWDIPYCKECGTGLPKTPRPLFLIVSSTVLFFLLGFPAGLIAVYSFTYIMFGLWQLATICSISAGIFSILLWFMLKMSDGTRP